jgi:hypothetical protein
MELHMPFPQSFFLQDSFLIAPITIRTPLSTSARFCPTTLNTVRIQMEFRIAPLGVARLTGENDIRMIVRSTFSQFLNMIHRYNKSINNLAAILEGHESSD